MFSSLFRKESPWAVRMRASLTVALQKSAGDTVRARTATLSHTHIAFDGRANM